LMWLGRNENCEIRILAVPQKHEQSDVMAEMLKM